MIIECKVPSSTTPKAYEHFERAFESNFGNSTYCSIMESCFDSTKLIPDSTTTDLISDSTTTELFPKITSTELIPDIITSANISPTDPVRTTDEDLNMEPEQTAELFSSTGLISASERLPTSQRFQMTESESTTQHFSMAEITNVFPVKEMQSTAYFFSSTVIELSTAAVCRTIHFHRFFVIVKYSTLVCLK